MRKDSDKQKKPVSKAKKIYNIISTIVVAMVFILMVVVVATMLALRKEGKDVKIFGYYAFNVLTDSMEDTINPGDVIISKEVDPNTLELYDIITFIAPSGAAKGQNITHRIVEIVPNEDGTVKYFKTQGDNPKAEIDNWELSPSAVKGKYVRTSKFISGFKNLLSKWYGYVLLIALPLVVVFSLVIAGYVKDRVALEKQKNEVEGSGETAAQSLLDNMSDEEKKKLLEDYLKDATHMQNGADNTQSDDNLPQKNDNQQDENNQIDD